MRKIILLFTLISSPLMAGNIERDKVLHFGVSVGLAQVSSYFIEDYRYSYGACLSVGLAKEVYDEIDYGGFDEKDLLADALGCGVGILINKQLFKNTFFENKLSFTAKEKEVGLNFKYYY